MADQLIEAEEVTCLRCVGGEADSPKEAAPPIGVDFPIAEAEADFQIEVEVVLMIEADLTRVVEEWTEVAVGSVIAVGAGSKIEEGLTRVVEVWIEAAEGLMIAEGVSEGIEGAAGVGSMIEGDLAIGAGEEDSGKQEDMDIINNSSSNRCNSMDKLSNNKDMVVMDKRTKMNKVMVKLINNLDSRVCNKDMDRPKCNLDMANNSNNKGMDSSSNKDMDSKWGMVRIIILTSPKPLDTVITIHKNEVTMENIAGASIMFLLPTIKTCRNNCGIS